MAYTYFEDGKPDATVEGDQLPAQISEQLNALRDALVSFALYGWNYNLEVGTGTTSQPQYHYLKKGSEWIRKTFTWGTSGGALGNVTQVVYEYSSDSGLNWSLNLGTCSYVYDSDGICTSSSWS